MASLIRECYKTETYFRGWKVAYSFAFSKIEIVKKTDVGSNNVPIVVFCVKNDLQKTKMLISHYRKLGVKKFAVLDNGSDDGTFRWLKEQKNVDLFFSLQKYQAQIKDGWINRIISYYGFNRWYLMVDSDEMVSYIGMEQHPLKDVISYANKRNIKVFKGIMIDMYTDGVIFDKHENSFKEYRWMDTDTYYEEGETNWNYKGNCYFGGPRERVMGCKLPLSKYPVCLFEEGTVYANAHYLYPFNLIEPTDCYLGILHFKFMSENLEKYKEIARSGLDFWNKGDSHNEMYVDFISKHKNASFMFEGSTEFVDSQSLRNINFIKEIEF